MGDDENVEDFIVGEPLEAPDFRLSCLTGPNSSTENLQPSPRDGSSQQVTSSFSLRSLFGVSRSIGRYIRL